MIDSGEWSSGRLTGVAAGTAADGCRPGDWRCTAFEPACPGTGRNLTGAINSTAHKLRSAALTLRQLCGTNDDD